MSVRHPIIAVTGSSGAGTSNAKTAFQRIFEQLDINAAIVEGDGFHRYERAEMKTISQAAADQGRNITHFGPEGNLFETLEALFAGYAQNGNGRSRYYIHSEQEAALRGAPSGSFTPWQPLPESSDILFYEGLHGGLLYKDLNIAQHIDLLIGVTPTINLEWIQKIHRDQAMRGQSTAKSTDIILSRMYDYVHYIVPQFSRTHINFQRVPTVDTANPFAASTIPGNDNSFSVVHIQDREKIPLDFPDILSQLDNSFMSAPDTMVVPSEQKVFAMQLILKPVIQELIAASKQVATP